MSTQSLLQTRSYSLTLFPQCWGTLSPKRSCKGNTRSFARSSMSSQKLLLNSTDHPGHSAEENVLKWRASILGAEGFQIIIYGSSWRLLEARGTLDGAIRHWYYLRLCNSGRRGGGKSIDNILGHRLEALMLIHFIPSIPLYLFIWRYWMV